MKQPNNNTFNGAHDTILLRKCQDPLDHFRDIVMAHIHSTCIELHTFVQTTQLLPCQSGLK